MFGREASFTKVNFFNTLFRNLSKPMSTITKNKMTAEVIKQLEMIEFLGRIILIERTK